MEQQHKATEDRIQILTTLNENYLPRLQVLVTSLGVNQPDDPADIWLMHSGIPQNALEPVSRQCRSYGFGFHPVEISSDAFLGAPVSSQYPGRCITVSLRQNFCRRACTASCIWIRIS